MFSCLLNPPRSRNAQGFGGGSNFGGARRKVAHFGRGAGEDLSEGVAKASRLDRFGIHRVSCRKRRRFVGARPKFRAAEREWTRARSSSTPTNDSAGQPPRRAGGAYRTALAIRRTASSSSERGVAMLSRAWPLPPVPKAGPGDRATFPRARKRFAGSSPSPSERQSSHAR